MTLNIVADENMTAVAELFGDLGRVTRVPGRTLSPDQLRDADVLLVRSVTTVDRDLLEGTPVKFVGSATIGTDHVDIKYLNRRGIPFASAPGCNADAVVDYVLAALYQLHEQPWYQKTVAIIGCGNVGGRLYHRLRKLDVTCVCYDPFLSSQQQTDLCDFEELAIADILCCHTPLTTIGPHPTFHLLNGEVLERLKPRALVLNAGRGAAVDNAALLNSVECGRLRGVLDVWEGEPEIDADLLSRVEIGTPHIAGYSLEGRMRGTLMVQQAFCKYFGLKASVTSLDALLAQQGQATPKIMAESTSDDPYQRVRDIVNRAYLPHDDYHRLLQVAKGGGGIGEGFDELRKTYPYRREFGFTRVVGETDPEIRAQLAAAGFLLD